MVQPDTNIDPFERYLRAAERARQEGIDTAPAALGTADEAGQPTVRVVLLRPGGNRRFLFYTHYNNRQAPELAGNPRAVPGHPPPSPGEPNPAGGPGGKV